MEEPVSVHRQGDEVLDLPPGFRFHPTDEEIVTYYLTEKVINSSFSATAVGEVDLNKCEPWDLPKKAKMGEKEWYFFCQKDRKYPTGTRTNRATESGYWKATGKDKEIFKGKGCLVGMKKTLVFYKGRAPKGEKSNWVMHEFRLEGKFASHRLPRAAKDEWAVCRVFHKNTGIKKATVPELLGMNSFADDLLDCSSLPPLMDPNYVDDDNHCGDEFKGTTTVSSAKSSDPGYYLPNFPMTNSLVKQEHTSNFQMPVNSAYTTCASFLANLTNTTIGNPRSGRSQVCVTNSSFPYQATTMHQSAGKNNYYAPGPVTAGSSGFWGRNEDAILRAFVANNDISGFKVQPFSSNQSRVSLSQDTGLSNDIKTETSSVVSKQDIVNNDASYNVDLGGPSVGPMSDLDYLWDDC